ncbi:uncharacterized protein LOC128244696 [Mya arenaria]|uniref:uncharacterized protein LOC128244696 n=1 Tax=Mya arenaria TaxID=6604 RepID=UPI0022E60125|nr:uncharacterized protein LOC128244696 [Mya arenaria]
MMERLLVFDWNTIQIKVYVIVKIIRITFFKPIVGDRLSTFHIKTAMLFTTEAYPPEIWREDNIAQCVIYCLVTLCRWLNIKFCPHYTIAEVNLFTGKLFSHEITIIAETITSMIGSNLQCIYLIEMDLLGARMSTLSSGFRMNESRSWRRSSQINILNVSVQRYSIILHSLITSLVVIQNNLKAVSLSQFIDRLVHISEQGTALQQEAASVLIPSLRCTLSSVLASRCINQGQPITPDILHLYQLSFDSDLLSSRLKFASMLYCCGQYEAAANCLTYCEGLLGPGVWQFCSCTNTYPEKPNKKYLENALKKSNTTILRKYTYFCINFTRHEMCCIPQFLVFEMFRTISEEDRQHPLHYEWMDIVAVDCEPFLHYLQFLTYRHLNQHDQTRKQMLKLDSFIENNFGRGHFDTTLNMLGHCFELLDMRDKAWMYYGKSLQLYPQNNAANWHVARLVHRRFTKENKLALGGNPHGSTS